MCNCISEVEEQLKASGKNTMLDIPISFSMTNGSLSGGKVTISTCKRDDKKREKPLRLFASFCPFCGEAYPSKQTAEQSAHSDAGKSADLQAESNADNLSTSQAVA